PPPVPSWPVALLPQHHSVPATAASSAIAQVWPAPEDTSRHVVGAPPAVVTAVGVQVAVTASPPPWPAPPEPHHCRFPAAHCPVAKLLPAADVVPDHGATTPVASAAPATVPRAMTAAVAARATRAR